jgi:ATP-binding cassette subfamily G (WHITE) protein 2 (SNQ2)
MSTVLAAPMANQLQVPFLDIRQIYETREGPTKIYSWTALITSQFFSDRELSNMRLFANYNLFTSALEHPWVIVVLCLLVRSACFCLCSFLCSLLCRYWTVGFDSSRAGFTYLVRLLVIFPQVAVSLSSVAGPDLPLLVYIVGAGHRRHGTECGNRGSDIQFPVLVRLHIVSAFHIRADFY